MTVKILLDTDIGSDIDDAVCLAYLLANPDCELLGVTTVSGNVESRAMLVSALCRVAGKKIPIYPGAELPLLTPIMQPDVPQAGALSKWAHETSFPARGEAIEFLRQTIRAHPGEVTLLGIGPMTNIALLFAVDPEIPHLLKQLVLMCGVFTTGPVGSREWNALNDPHATAIVYRAPVKIHRSLGLDVTNRVRMEASLFKEKCQVPLLRPVLDYAEIWFQNARWVTFHDPLAATTLFHDDICTFQRGTVEVETSSERAELRGLTSWQPDAKDAHHEIAVDVQPERFFEHYFSVFQA